MQYRVKEFRIKNGMTQQELAEKSGVSRQTIIGLENGTNTITTTATLVKIANALGKNPSDIFYHEYLAR